MLEKIIGKIFKTLKKKLEVLSLGVKEKKKVVYACAVQKMDEFLVFFKKQAFVVEADAIAKSVIGRYSTLKSSFRKFVGVVVDKYSTLNSFFRSSVKNTIGKYIKLKSSFRSSVTKVIEALIVNRLFIAFARLVQKIFWVCAGIGIYACLLIKTQPDGYERVTDVLKHFFPWIW